MDDGLKIINIITIVIIIIATKNLIISNIIMAILLMKVVILMIAVECSGGGHPFWPTGCSPCFQRIPSPLWGSSPALPLGSAGRYNTHMAIGGWMKQNIKGEPGVGDPGLWDRHKLLLHIFRGERQGERLPEPKKGRTDVRWSSLNAGRLLSDIASQNYPFCCLLAGC